MQKIEFSEKLDAVVTSDPRYHRDAYIFLRDALDFTIKQRKKNKDESRHVTGQQLLEGIRLFALKEFGPMVVTVLSYWGVRRCEDIGEMVFNLIRAEIFGKTDRDCIDDFKHGYNFQEAFVTPFVPLKEPATVPEPEPQPSEKLK